MNFSNWAAGGGDDFSITAGIKTTMNPSFSNGIWGFVASADAEFSTMKSSTQPSHKTNDRLELSLKVGRKIGGVFHVVAESDLQSQCWPGYDLMGDPGQKKYSSNFLAPGYFLYGIALDARFDSLNLSVLVAPFGVKKTVVLDRGVDPTKYGLPAGAHQMTEFGAFAHITFTRDILPKTTLTLKSILFANYTEKFSPDLSLFVELDYNIASYIKIFGSVQMLNDDDIKVNVYTDLDHDGSSNDFVGVGPRLQFNTQLGISLTVDF
jgi:hypothetical protein